MVWIAGAYARSLGMASLSIFLKTGFFSLWLLGLLEISRHTSIDPDRAYVAFGVSLLLPVVLIPLAPVLYRSRTALHSRRIIRHALNGIVAFGAVTVTNGIIILIPLQVLGWYGLAHDAGVYNAALRVSMFVGAFGVVIKSVIVRQEARRTASPRTDGGCPAGGHNDRAMDCALISNIVAGSFLGGDVRAWVRRASIRHPSDAGRPVRVCRRKLDRNSCSAGRREGSVEPHLCNYPRCVTDCHDSFSRRIWASWCRVGIRHYHRGQSYAAGVALCARIVASSQRCRPCPSV